MKSISCALLAIVLCTRFAFAQEIKFDKKSGEFSAGGPAIAKLEDEKVKGLGGKNFFLKDATGQVELMAYILHRWQDTFGGPTVYYYEMRCTPLGLSTYRPNFNGMLNTYREVGEHIASKGLLLPDGKLNEAAVRSYFAAANADMGDYPARLKKTNDSMAALAAIDAQPVERDRRKAIAANEYGKIGQGNTTIGAWEFIETKSTEPGGSSTYHFRIKNLAGGIVCISWISISGTHTYVFKGGARSEERWNVVDLVNNNPIQHKEAYVTELSTQLVRMGLL